MTLFLFLFVRLEETLNAFYHRGCDDNNKHWHHPRNLLSRPATPNRQYQEEATQAPFAYLFLI